MAKKFVRGITDVKTINNQDFDTNNVNDLLSDGQYNYIHRKKGKTEEYHNLTDNIKTISSDNTDLLTVTNNNKTTNTATLHPKHDAQKEQVLESTRDTITINHGTNGTAEKTTVDTNPKKVLEHENLLTDYGISKTKSGNTIKLGLEYTQVPDDFDLNTVENGRVRGYKLLNAPNYPGWYFVDSFNEGELAIQKATSLYDDNTSYVRFKVTSEWGPWREQVGDKSAIDDLLSQKQNKLTAGDGLAIESNEIKIKPKNVETLPSNSGFYNGTFMDGEWGNPYTSISLNIDTNKFIQLAFRESVNTSGLIIGKYRFIVNNVPSTWKEMQLDSGYITSLLAQKQNKLTAGDGITIEGQTVDTNPEKVLEHTNLLTDYGISKTTTGNTTKLGLEYTKVPDDFDLNTVKNGRVRGYKLLNAPNYPGWYFVDSFNEGELTIQKATSLHDDNTSYVRFKATSEWGPWREQVGDKSAIDATIDQLTARLTALEEKVAQLHPHS